MRIGLQYAPHQLRPLGPVWECHASDRLRGGGRRRQRDHAHLRPREKRCRRWSGSSGPCDSRLMVVQPTGTVTLLFTDVEGSTLLLERLGAERFAEVLALHRRVLREAFARHGGYEVDEEGDAFLVAFQARARRSRPRVRHSRAWRRWCGRTRVGCGCGWVCTPVSRCRCRRSMWGWMCIGRRRIMAAGHGGQVLVSETTAALLDGAPLRDLGPHRLKDMLAADPALPARGRRAAGRVSAVAVAASDEPAGGCVAAAGA